MEYSEAALQKVREDRLLIDAVDQWLYEEIAPYLGHRVLEIGCGLGNFARHLTDREFYLGTETSAESIDHVEQVFAGHPNMRFAVADATAPPSRTLPATTSTRSSPSTSSSTSRITWRRCATPATCCSLAAS